MQNNNSEYICIHIAAPWQPPTTKNIL